MVRARVSTGMVGWLGRGLVRGWLWSSCNVHTCNTTQHWSQMLRHEANEMTEWLKLRLSLPVGTFSSWTSGLMCNMFLMSRSIRSITMMSSSSRSSHSWGKHTHSMKIFKQLMHTIFHINAYIKEVNSSSRLLINMTLRALGLQLLTFWQRSARTVPRVFITSSSVKLSLYSRKYLWWEHTKIKVFANLAIPWIIAHGPRPKNDK